MASRSQQVDEIIVAELQRDARQSNVAIAKHVSLSEGAVRRRIDNLVESGAIRFTVAVQPTFLGRDSVAILRIRCAPHLVDEVLVELSQATELEHLYLCTGPFDITAVGHFGSNSDLREFQTGRLGSIPGIVEIQSDVVLQVVDTVADVRSADSDAGDAPAAAGSRT